MQYYDVPSRYEILSIPETVMTEAAGDVYYSEPNRIVLFYGDAAVRNCSVPGKQMSDMDMIRNKTFDEKFR